MSTFYVYELRTEAGIPFYVGKGKGYRMTNHRKYAENGKVGYLYNKIRKIWREGKDYVSEIVFESPFECLAFAEEIRLIAFYGRDNLCNQTDGGEGCAGVVFSEERKQAMRGRIITEETKQKLKDHWAAQGGFTEEHKRKISEGNKGKVISEETKRKISEAQIGKIIPEETKEKMRQARVGMKLSEEHKEKLRISSTGRKHTEESKALMREKQKGKVISPEALENMRAAKKIPISEETRKKMSESQKRRMQNPEERARLTAKLHATLARKDAEAMERMEAYLASKASAEVI